MQVTCKIETAEFKATLREWLSQTTRELSKALNARMFYLMLRFYLLIPPQQVTAARQKVRTYLNAVLSQRTRTTKTGKVKPLSKARQLQRVYLIAQSRRIKAGLPALIPSMPNFAEEMKKAAGGIRRSGISGQGYLKSAAVKVLKQLNGGFAQWGQPPKGGKTPALTKPAVPPNAALAAIGAEYGLDPSAGNVGVFKNAKGSVALALPGISPAAVATLQIGLKDSGGNEAKVSAIMLPAMSRAMDDERAEMERHLAGIGQAVANGFQEKQLTVTV